MRKAMIIIAGVLTLLFGALSVIPADAGGQGAQAPAATQTSQAAQTGQTGWKMGGLPNHYTICIANGYGPTAGVVRNWNWTGFRLSVSLLNRCDGYSITNRMTIDNFADSSQPCLKLTNVHRTWSPGQGYYIWDQNPVVWINTASPCFDTPAELYHRMQMYVGYVLGLHLDTTACSCVMGSTQFDMDTTPYVTYVDAADMNRVYG